MSAITLYTHDGSVHADDAFACAILTLIYPDARVIRTRDQALIAQQRAKEGNFFLDIGGEYNPQARLFDHHQTAGAGFRDDQERWPYATAGLVWLHYGRQAVRALHADLTHEEVAEVVSYIDIAIFRYVDAIDCGIRFKTAGPSLSSLIGSFNVSGAESGCEQFELVKALCQHLLMNYIRQQVAKIEARSRVQRATCLHEGRVMVLDAGMAWGDTVAEHFPEVKIVVYPVTKQSNIVQWQIRTARNTDRTSRMLLPSTWGGLADKVLSIACGQQTALFCHRALHLAGALTKEDALGMAHKALMALDTNERMAA